MGQHDCHQTLWPRREPQKEASLADKSLQQGLPQQLWRTVFVCKYTWPMLERNQVRSFCHHVGVFLSSSSSPGDFFFASDFRIRCARKSAMVA